jgi:hypothetical protein
VGDYFKANGEFTQWSGMACDVIAWLRSKSAILALIREALRDANQAEKTVIRAQLTRWTTNYLSLGRLLVLRPVLNKVITDDEMKDDRNRIVVQGDSSSKVKAKKFVGVIRNALFWHKVAQIKHHLAPLAIASTMSQATFCRLDEVLLIFGFLLREFEQLTDEDEGSVRRALIGSLNRRWSKSDREPFIMALLLNPLVRKAPFNGTNRLFSPAKIERIAANLWTRFYQKPPPSRLFKDMNDFFYSQGVFDELRWVVSRELSSADEEVSAYMPH